jgi:hypothetical protein
MGLLLRAGADINQRNLAGFTSLHQAAKRGAYSTCKKKARSVVLSRSEQKARNAEKLLRFSPKMFSS